MSTKVCPYCSETIQAEAIKCKHCGSMLDSAAAGFMVDPISGVRVALSRHYDIIGEIGHGGMAVVYKAQQKSLGRIVALKVLPQQYTHDQEFLERFHREAQESARLTHPNIVKIYNQGSENGVHFIAMEYLDGTDLLALIKKQGTINPSSAANIIVPIAEALDFAHRSGVIHRDVKTSNIIVTKDGRPVLMDFGIAHAARWSKLTKPGTLLGTPEYMSPEQALGQQIDGRADLYSLGVVLFECLSGKVPLKSANPISTVHQVVNSEPPLISKVNPDVPAWLETIVMRLLAKKPEERYQTGCDLANALRGGVGGSGSDRSAPRQAAAGASGGNKSAAASRPAGTGSPSQKSGATSRGEGQKSPKSTSRKRAVRPEVFILFACIVVVILLLMLLLHRRNTSGALSEARPLSGACVEVLRWETVCHHFPFHLSGNSYD